MAFSNLRNTANVAAPAGSPYAVYCLVTDVTATLISDTFYSAPMLIDSNYAGATEKTEISYEDDVKKTLKSDKTVTLSWTLGQRDAITKNWVEFELPGNTVCLGKEEHTVAVGGVYQYLFFPLCEFQGDFTANAKGIEREIAFTTTVAAADIGINTSALTSTVTGWKKDMPALVTCPAGQAFVRVLVSA